jgi:hypothetical protein
VFKANGPALAFYMSRLKYDIADISPSRSGGEDGEGDGGEAPYEILAKCVDPAGWGAYHVSGGVGGGGGGGGGGGHCKSGACGNGAPAEGDGGRPSGGNTGARWPPPVPTLGMPTFHTPHSHPNHAAAHASPVPCAPLSLADVA